MHVPNLHLLPQTHLKNVLSHPASIRLVKNKIENGKRIFQIDALVGKGYQQMWFNEDTLLIKMEILRASSVYGDGMRIYEFLNYKKIQGIAFPSIVHHTNSNSVFGEAINTYYINETTVETESTGLMLKWNELPAAKQPKRVYNEIVKLAENIYMIENITNSSGYTTYNILFAEFENFILVAEAQLNNAFSEKVIKKIKEFLPGKEIRYIVQTHHHNDHIGGIRGYVAEGSKIVTTPGNVELVKRIAKAPFNLSPDRLAKEPREPVFEIVTNKKLLIEDNIQSAVVIDIGPTPHSNEMLVIYFPKQGLLFQSDMTMYGGWPLNSEITKFFVSKLKELNLTINTIVGSHAGVIKGNNVEKLLKGELADPF